MAPRGISRAGRQGLRFGLTAANRQWRSVRRRRPSRHVSSDAGLGSLRCAIPGWGSAAQPFAMGALKAWSSRSRACPAVQPFSTKIRHSSGGAGMSACAKTRQSADGNLPGRNAPIQAVQMRNQRTDEWTFCIRPGLGHSGLPAIGGDSLESCRHLGRRTAAFGSR